MRVVVIGGTGRTATYLIPRLIEAGHEVTVISRQRRKPYQPNHTLGRSAWERVAHIEIDRAEAEAVGKFGVEVSQLKPDIVIDMICYKPESAQQLVDSLRGRIQLLLHCGTIWASGPGIEVPNTEIQPRRPASEYCLQKAAIEAYLLDEARRAGFPAVVLRPGHLVGQGWTPINPAGNLNPNVYRDLAQGNELYLPNFGMETLHHVHADDVAQAFMAAITNWSGAAGENFNITSGSALTLKGYAETVAKWFGQPARLHFLAWNEWRRTVSEDDARVTWDHLIHSSNASNEKARRILGFSPRYSSLEAVKESLTWLIQNGKIDLGGDQRIS